MRIVFYHGAAFPPMNRKAAAMFWPLAGALDKMGHKTLILAPDVNFPKKPEWPAVNWARFATTEDIFRWLPGNADLLIVWTNKGIEQKMADMAREHAINVLFAELAWRPHYMSLYLDPKGCGPDSLMVHMNPPAAEKMVLPDRKSNLAKDMVGILLQMEQDYAWRASPYAAAGDFVNDIQKRWQMPVLVRPHPFQQDVKLPRGVAIDHSSSIADFAEQCRCVVGLNTSALYECVALGYPCYMLADGPGRYSGAFIPELRRPDLSVSEYATLRKRGADLIEELFWHRQIRVDEPITESVILGNRELAACLHSPDSSSLPSNSGVVVQATA